MILISHRGNTQGRNEARENTPSYIEEAIKAGFIVEIDIFSLGGQLFLGHNIENKLKIEKSWLDGKANDLLIHCKNLDAARFCSKFRHLNFFFHESDPYVVSSIGWVIGHSTSRNQSDIICMLPERLGLAKESIKYCAGVCSDIISFYK